MQTGTFAPTFILYSAVNLPILLRLAKAIADDAMAHGSSIFGSCLSCTSSTVAGICASGSDSPFELLSWLIEIVEAGALTLSSTL
jgi:hypothetical protein